MTESSDDPPPDGDDRTAGDTAAPTESAWFSTDSEESLTERVRTGTADAPADWPTLAVESGFAEDTDHYESMLRETTMAAAREAVRERERANDQQLIHAIRAVDDTRRTANELAERVSEWAGSLFDLDDTEGSGPTADDGGVAYARRIAEQDADGDPVAQPVVSLARQVVALDEQADDLEAFVTEHAPTVAPNLSALAGPV
ncbi:MAG: hypothetical protein ABEI99_04880, partial [Halobaculum sp.]